mgnify:CR=1 FL=1
MCIRDSLQLLPAAGAGSGDRAVERIRHRNRGCGPAQHRACLLYTSDAADERSSVDLGGRRIIKKKNNEYYRHAGRDAK